jgi:hypothetical protein
VRVTDGGTNWALADEVTVNFSISSIPGTPTATGQSLGGASDATDASGYAEQTFTFGDRAGNYQIEATCTDCNTTTFTVTAGQHFSLSVVEDDINIYPTTGASEGDTASPTINVTTNAASFEIQAVPGQWPAYSTFEILNWTGVFGFGWLLDGGSTTAFSESAGNPAATTVYTCTGDICQGDLIPNIDFKVVADYSLAVQTYTNDILLSGYNINY